MSGWIVCTRGFNDIAVARVVGQGISKDRAVCAARRQARDRGETHILIEDGRTGEYTVRPVPSEKP